MLMGAGLLGATVLVGYAMGKIGGRQSSTIKNEEAGGRSYAASSGEARETSNEQTSERESQSRTLSKSTPASVIRKSDEAAQSMPNSGSSSSSGSIPPMASEGESIVAPANVTVSEAGSSSSGATSLSSEGETEDEDASQAAFNPETGEINWDCPCLGGMAHGVCGEEFKAAFSCFVYSQEEPKGQDCIDRFRGMQDCFRAHPDVYGEGESRLKIGCKLLHALILLALRQKSQEMMTTTTRTTKQAQQEVRATLAMILCRP